MHVVRKRRTIFCAIAKIPRRWHACDAVRYSSDCCYGYAICLCSPCRRGARNFLLVDMYTPRAERHQCPPSGTMELRCRRRFAPRHQKCTVGGFDHLRITIRRNAVTTTTAHLWVVRGFKPLRVDAIQSNI